MKKINMKYKNKRQYLHALFIFLRFKGIKERFQSLKITIIIFVIWI